MSRVLTLVCDDCGSAYTHTAVGYLDSLWPAGEYLRYQANHAGWTQGIKALDGRIAPGWGAYDLCSTCTQKRVKP